MKLKTLFILAPIVFLFSLYLDKCKEARESMDTMKAYQAYKDTVKMYKALNGEMRLYNDALRISADRLMALNDSMAEELKNARIKEPMSITRVNTKTIIDSIRVEFVDTLPCSDFTRNFTVDSTHYKLFGKLDKRSLTLDSIIIPNHQGIIVGYKSNGFLRRKSLVVTVDNSNPYVNVTGIRNYTIENESKWYQRWYTHMAAGFLMGFVIFHR